MVRTYFVGAALVLTAGSALGAKPCATSDECGELRCIEETCQDPETLAPRRDRVPTSPGFRLMFGDGHEYRAAVVVGDLAACLIAEALIGVTFATSADFNVYALAALFPTTLTGPIFHLANGRVAAAILSFVGWASVPPTASAFAGLVASSSCCDRGNNNAPIAGVLVTSSAAGAILMMVIDWYMARPVEPERTPFAVRWSARVVPLRSGAMGALVGIF